MVDISVFSIVVAAVSVTIAAVFAIFQMRNLVKARMTTPATFVKSTWTPSIWAPSTSIEPSYNVAST